VDSGAWPITNTSELSRIPDLRDTGLGQLASHAAAGEKTVTGVVSRTVDSQKVISAIPAMKFNSAI
jgi:hypothetical protein